MQTIVRVVIVIVGFVLLAGCVAAQQQQAVDQQSAASAAQDCRSALSDPAIGPILGKVTINVNDITSLMRTNTQHVAASEKLAIEAWAEARRRCSRGLDASRRVSMQPKFYAIQTGVERKTDALIAKLYSGELSYGDFNNKRIENVAEGGRQIAKIKQEQAAGRTEALAREQYCLQLYSDADDWRETAQCHNYQRCAQFPLDSSYATQCYYGVSHSILIIRQVRAQARTQQETDDAIQSLIDAANARAAVAAQRAREEGFDEGYSVGRSVGK